jgi:hypothetical protein
LSCGVFITAKDSQASSLLRIPSISALSGFFTAAGCFAGITAGVKSTNWVSS